MKRLPNGLRECECDGPEPMLHKPDVCVKCGYRFDPAWMASTTNVRDFLRELEEATPGGANLSFERLEAQIIRRQIAGESIFRQEFLDRANLAEAREEIADFILYLALHRLRCRREGIVQERELLFSAAYHAARAHDALDALDHAQRVSSREPR
jgi:hypothetical protein